MVAETSDKRTTGHLAAVHVVSEEEAAAGMYSIDDVVLPLPGSCISYPEHATAQVLRHAQISTVQELCGKPKPCGMWLIVISCYTLPSLCPLPLCLMHLG